MQLSDIKVGPNSSVLIQRSYFGFEEKSDFVLVYVKQENGTVAGAVITINLELKTMVYVLTLMFYI